MTPRTYFNCPHFEPRTTMCMYNAMKPQPCPLHGGRTDDCPLDPKVDRRSEVAKGAEDDAGQRS